jgi:N-acyl-D-amino-acid deacylase
MARRLDPMGLAGGRWRRLRGLMWGTLWAAVWRGTRDTSAPPEFQTLIRGGTVYDGTGAAPRVADLGLAGGRIVAIGDLAGARARDEIDARGLAVAPGFINMLSWATESLIVDPRAESDLRQGVTLEIFGEGVSMGPLTAAMRRALESRQSDYRFNVDWTTLGEYLESLERRGIATNVASFVGATTLRVHEIGYAHRPARADELARMCELVRAAMREGALGVGSALIYAPAACATPGELRALALAAAEYGGSYITHLRSESGRLLESIDEVIGIARATGRHAEIYHFKAAGEAQWPDAARAIERIEQARAEGLDLSANMYPYTAAASGLDACMPPWVQEGGHAAWVQRLREPQARERVLREMRSRDGGWENLYAAAGSPERVRLLGFRNPALRPFAGRSLAEVAAARGSTPEETIIDLVIEDDSRVTAAFFLMSEQNVRRQLELPWMGICSDEEALAPREPFLAHRPHPRAYGSFARFLGSYVRDAGLVPLETAIHRLTGMPAAQLGLRGRGRLAPGCFADVVVFDAGRIADHATYDAPQRFATGVEHVLVNGVPVLRDGRVTGARPGRVVRGPGWSRRASPDAALDLPRAAG